MALNNMNTSDQGVGSGQIVARKDHDSIKYKFLKNKIDDHLRFCRFMSKKGGPNVLEHFMFLDWVERISREFKNGRLTGGDLKNIHKTLGEACSAKTLLGFALVKPHGYAGDYEIIDKVHQNCISNDSKLKNWDSFIHKLCATKAVKNRKQYFISLLETLESSYKGNHTLNVLNIASGPGRDMYEFFRDHRSERIRIDCVEIDQNAIDYAKDICRDFLHLITFQKKNAFRYTTQKKYHLIWSAGLFDYFDDRRFKFLLKKIYTYLHEDGELVIGNFGKDNPSRACMEILMEWFLNYRSREQLIQLAIDCGIVSEDIRIGQEPEGCNLFLHIKKGENFIL